MIVSPILSVAVFVPFGLVNVFVIDFATFGNSIIVLALSIVPQLLHVTEVAAASILSALRFGVRCLAGRRLFNCPNFFEAASMLLMLRIGYTLADTTGSVNSNDTGATMTLSCFGAGSLSAGAFPVAWRGPKPRMNGDPRRWCLPGLEGSWPAGATA